MHRRDVLLLRPRGGGARVFELPCDQLYMQYLETRRAPADASPVLEDYWLGEPEPAHQLRTSRELFDALTDELAAADVLRIVDPQWLADPDLRREVDALVDRFRARGGRVELVVAGPPPPSA